MVQQCNPYVQDFIKVCEIPPDQVESMQLVISPVIKRTYDHAGVYNEPTGFKEVQVLMSDSMIEKEHSIIVRKRRENGALQSISDIHQSFDSLHYPLLFPEGEDSWYIGMPLEGSCWQLSACEFYVYHLHEHDDERQTLF